MSVLTVIKNRRSIRQYSSKSVGDDKLEMVLEAARLSPSASNLQSRKFVVVREEETKRKLAEAAGGQKFLLQAPIIIVACGTDTEKMMLCGQHTYNIDVSIAVSYLALAAEEIGLGTCWLGHFDENKVKEILHIPEEVRVVTMIPLGYPAETPGQRTRKDMKEVVCYEKYE